MNQDEKKVGTVQVLSLCSELCLLLPWPCDLLICEMGNWARCGGLQAGGQPVRPCLRKSGDVVVVVGTWGPSTLVPGLMASIT